VVKSHAPVGDAVFHGLAPFVRVASVLKSAPTGRRPWASILIFDDCLSHGVSELNEGCDVDLVSPNSFLERERVEPFVNFLLRQFVTIHSYQHAPQKFASLLKNAPNKVVKERSVSDL